MKLPRKRTLPTAVKSSSNRNIQICVILEHLTRIFKQGVYEDLREKDIKKFKDALNKAKTFVEIADVQKKIKTTNDYYNERLENVDIHNSEMHDLFNRNGKTDDFVEFVGDVACDNLLLTMELLDKFQNPNKNMKLAIVEEDPEGKLEIRGSRWNIHFNNE